MIRARSEVVGSLLRPARLTQARERLERGEMAAADFKQVEDACVDDAIGLQERAGIDVQVIEFLGDHLRGGGLPRCSGAIDGDNRCPSHHAATRRRSSQNPG